VVVSPPQDCFLDGLTLVIASRNEEASLESVLKEWWGQRPEGIPYELLVVDDASVDSTPEILERLKSEIPMRVIRNPRPQGFGGSLRVGARHAATGWVAFTDADAQYDPNDLPKLLEALRAGTDLAIGWRTPRADPFVRVAISIGFRGLLYSFFSLRSRDPTTSLKAGRAESVREVAESVQYMNGSFWNEFMIRWIRSGRSFTEVPIHHYPRREGQSKVAARGLIMRVSIQQLIALLKVWREFHRLGPVRRAKLPSTSPSSEPER
jgi:glycosyltransferase involved in cell wall biosynthesis